MSASVLNASIASGSASTNEVVSAAGDLLLLINIANGGTTDFVTAISDTGGNSWTPVWGTLGASSTKKEIGGTSFYASAFYAYADGSVGSGAITLTYNTLPPQNVLGFVDCGQIASSGAILGAIGIDQSAISGTNVVTCAGGTSLTGNGDDITSEPALVVMLSYASTSTISAGTSPITFTQNATKNSPASIQIESGLATSTGTFDACASQSASATVISVQFALAQAGGGGARLLLLDGGLNGGMMDLTGGCDG